ncbi:hypothetical protein HYR69_03180 [Candidatus Sumerlaeota bacterium]|nr:hypothetical protein [Candidatus Sumerlaeota bacterium]MBI3736198.1 hypothetical protein [Candidatus Sumerlaeota bacterium]
MTRKLRYPWLDGVEIILAPICMVISGFILRVGPSAASSAVNRGPCGTGRAGDYDLIIWIMPAFVGISTLIWAFLHWIGGRTRVVRCASLVSLFCWLLLAITVETLRKN